MKYLIFFFAMISAGSAYSQYDNYEEDGVSYDSLVSDLARQRSDYDEGDLFANVRFHMGVGFSNSVFSVALPNQTTTFASQRGVEATFGIDLFSPNWVAEGAVLTYGEQEYEKARLSLREFDLRVVWLHSLDSALRLKLGVGLAARYLKANYEIDSIVNTPEGPRLQKTWHEEEYSTPSSWASLGLVRNITNGFSVGAEVASRNSLTQETPDQSSLDLSLKVAGHF